MNKVKNRQIYWHFLKQGTEIVSKHMDRCSAMFMPRDIQIKAQWDISELKYL